VVQYSASYKNPGTSSVQQVFATLPIPDGMEYLPRTASPAQVQASLDGKRFEPVPLKRRARLEDGREVVREVPFAEYRYLRWSLGAIGARGQESVSARVRVSPTAPAVAASVKH
jgi:uncharacterized repeat protein (TIGR01451 family)